MNSEGTIAVKSFSRDNIEFIKEIGSGSFGKVYKAQLRDSKATLAVKVFYQEFIGILPNVDSKIRANAYDELAKVAVLDHENIVRLLGMVEDDIPWLIFEYMKDGNLLEYVMRKQEIKEKTLLRFCRDICNGMKFLHQNNFLHKDLAARNILLDGKKAKIADMGLCSFLTEEHNGSYALGGKLFPYRHAAAECIVECIFTFESDIWSFGVLLFEIFSGGAVPYGKENKQPEVRRFIADGLSPMDFLEPRCSDNIRTIMKTIFTLNREDRPPFSELLQYFDALLAERRGSSNMRIPRATRRDTSPFRPSHQQQRRLHEPHGSSDRLSSSPSSSSGNFLDVGFHALQGDRRNSQNFSSTPDIHGNLSNTNANGHGTSGIGSRNQSRANQHPHSHKGQGQGPLRSISPPNFQNESRRSSETPGLSDRSGSMSSSSRPSRRDDLLRVENSGIGSGSAMHRGISPRRTASFNNIARSEIIVSSHHQQHVDQNLLKDFVPNRFGGGRK